MSQLSNSSYENEYCTYEHVGLNVVPPRSVNKVGVSCKLTSASNSNPLAVSVFREIHSSWCLQRISTARRPIAQASLKGETPCREIVKIVQPLLDSEKLQKKYFIGTYQLHTSIVG